MIKATLLLIIYYNPLAENREAFSMLRTCLLFAVCRVQFSNWIKTTTYTQADI